MLTDPYQEALEVQAGAGAAGIAVRLTGGLAVRYHCPRAQESVLKRCYKDLDVAVRRVDSGAFDHWVTERGYAPDKNFNALNGSQRRLYYDEKHGRQLDVFVEWFDMCHEIPIMKRYQVEPVTIPLAELFLTKIQIVQLNEKDVRDLYTLLLDHKVGRGDEETINCGVIAGYCAENWGLFRTLTGNLEKLAGEEFSNLLQLAPEDWRTIRARITVLTAAVLAEPKGMRWKIRDKIGDRVPWYKLPEEV